MTDIFLVSTTGC